MKIVCDNDLGKTISIANHMGLSGPALPCYISQEEMLLFDVLVKNASSVKSFAVQRTGKSFTFRFVLTGAQSV